MSLKFGTETVSEVKFNNQDVKQIIYNGQSAWCKPYAYLRGNLPTGVASLTCHRASSNEPKASASVGTTAIIYHGDVLYWTATAATGYSVSVTHGSSNPITVTGSVSGVSASGVSASLNSYSVTISATNCKSVYLSTSSTATSGSTSGTNFNYGTKVYGFAELNDDTAQYSYSAPSGWTHITGRIYRIGSVTVSTSGNSISGTATSTLRSYTITFNATSYGTWSSATKTAYYGDYISVSGTTVICKAGGSSGSERWRNTCTRTADTAQYSYWLSIDSGYGVTVTGNYTITTSSGRNLRAYTYYTGTLPTGIASLTCYRASSPYAGASTGAISNGATIYYGDTLYYGYTLSTGYQILCNMYYDSSHTYTVTSDVTGATNTAIAAQVKSYTYYTGTLPAGIASLTCYRTSSPYQGATTGVVDNNSTIYYGDTLYYGYTLEPGYQIYCNVYYDQDHTYTVTSDVTGVTNTQISATAVASWNTVTNATSMVITNTSYWNVYNLGYAIQYQFKTKQTAVIPARLRITILTKSGLSSSQGASYNAASYKFTSEKTIYANEGYVTVHNDGTLDYEIMVTQSDGYVYVTVRTVDDEGWEDTEYFTNNSRVQVQLYY